MRIKPIARLCGFRRGPLHDPLEQAVGQAKQSTDGVMQRGERLPAIDSSSRLLRRDQADGDLHGRLLAQKIDEHPFAIARAHSRIDAVELANGPSTMDTATPGAMMGRCGKIGRTDRRITSSASDLSISAAISSSGQREGTAPTLTTLSTPIVLSTSATDRRCARK